MLINTTLQYDSEAAAGTGMVVNADGLVLTNNHVIEDSTKISATVTSTGKTYPARVVGYNQTGDVALIQLQNASGLTTVPIGNSSSVKAGNAVVAMGNAEGQGHVTAAAGHVTALNTTITASDEAGSTSTETLHGMIQTNANIVPGDSGGPLADWPASSAWTPRATTRATSRDLPPDSRSRSTRRCRSPGRSPPGTPARSSRSATRLPGSLRRLWLQQRSADAGTAAGAAEWRLRRFREHPGVLSPAMPDLTIPSVIAPVSSGTLIDGTICGSPAASAACDRRSGHHGGEGGAAMSWPTVAEVMTPIPPRRYRP